MIRVVAISIVGIVGILLDFLLHSQYSVANRVVSVHLAVLFAGESQPLLGLFRHNAGLGV